MSKQQNLLRNIECEYKFALNPAYVAGFVREFCEKFNEVIALRYQTLPLSFTNSHQLSDFMADPSTACKESLQNEYFDTAEDLLFANYMSGLRLRRSSKGSGVEQTLKCKGRENTGSAHTHKELNVNIDQELAVPDLTLFPAADLPEGMLDLVQEHPLLRKYQTDFVRESITLTVPLFLTFELAVDQGDICARNGDEEHHSPICEVEFELKALDADFLQAMGSNVYDLDDVRLEFSAFINEIMLLMAGAPKEYLDSAHLFGLVSHFDVTPDSYAGVATGESSVSSDENPFSTSTAKPEDADDAADMAESFAAASAAAAAEAAAAEAAAAETADTTEEGSDATAEIVGVSTSRTKDVATNTDSAATAASVRRAMRQLSLQPSPRKEGGLIGREPFSKLKRAVLLNARYGANAKSGAEEQFRVDLVSVQNDIAAYNQQQQPTLASFIVMVNKLAALYSTAMGYANLFGLRENFEDVRDVCALSLNFALHHKPFSSTHISKRRHHLMCQEPELRDLSMLSVCECSSMFIEINCNLWLAPFYQELTHALESNKDLTLDQFKALCRCASNNSYALKASEYVERLLYILKRRAMIFGFDNDSEEQGEEASVAIGDSVTDSNLTTEQTPPASASADSEDKTKQLLGSWLQGTGFASEEERNQIHQVALATQYHMRLMWNNI